MLFFQPFSSRFTDFNNILIFNAGFGLIVFLFLCVIQILSRALRRSDIEVFSYASGFVLLVLSSVAFAFYLRYVGQTSIGFYPVLKIFLICLAPPVILRLYYINREVIMENDLLCKENAFLQSRLQDMAEDSTHRTLTFYSADGATEMLRLRISDIVLVKSADNYVEIYFRESSALKKKLIRNTLKNIEQLLSPYNLFIRCHRTYIINIGRIEKLQLKVGSSFIVLHDLDEHIPVSRQYILMLKEALAAQQG